MTVPRSPAPHHGGKGPRAASLDGKVERKVSEKAISWRNDVHRSSTGGNGHTCRRPSGRHNPKPLKGLVGARNGAKTEGWSRRLLQEERGAGPADQPFGRFASEDVRPEDRPTYDLGGSVEV